MRDSAWCALGRWITQKDCPRQLTDFRETKFNVPFVQQNINIIALKLLMYKK